MPAMSRGRRALMFAMLFGLLAVIVEIGSFFVLWWVYGEVRSPRSFYEEREAIRIALVKRLTTGTDDKTAETMREHLAVEALHPYLGFVVDHDTHGAPDENWGGQGAHAWGLVGELDLPRERDPDRVVVAILGGSVAFLFSLDGAPRLVELLQQDPRYAGKEIEILRLAWGGYKQPQQLMALNYFLTAGAPIDVAVAIDGFNEVALSLVENVEHGVAAIYPRSWPWRVRDLPDPQLRRMIGAAVYHEQARRALSSIFSKGPQSRLYTWNLLWKVLDRRVRILIERAEIRIRRHGGRASEDGQRPYVERGPFQPADTDTALDRIVGQWRRASLAMHDLCEGAGIRYVQFLQPNQYVEGSKPMSAEERAVAWRDDHPYRKAVVLGYPKLLASGAELLTAGVDFHDLTPLFADVEEPIYADDCCHVNERGNAMLADAIAQALLAD